MSDWNSYLATAIDSGVGPVVLALAVVSAVLSVGWLILNPRRSGDRLHWGQVSISWAWAFWIEVCLIALIVMIDGRISAFDSANPILFFLMIMVVLPLRMIGGTWRWSRAGRGASLDSEA